MFYLPQQVTVSPWVYPIAQGRDISPYLYVPTMESLAWHVEETQYVMNEQITA